MIFGKHGLFGTIAARMDWLGDRQRVLAQNVANADTPGYAPRDLKPLSFAAQLAAAPVALARTDPQHVAGQPPENAHGVRKLPEGDATTLSGNAVDLETELMKVSETRSDYQTMSNLYARHLAMLKTAIGRTGG